MKIEIHPYQLQLRSGANALTGTLLHGALLRNGDAFACLQPWPTLGDASLETCLDQLRRGVSENSLVTRVVDFLGQDLPASIDGVPPSYFSVAEWMEDADFRAAAEQGFRGAKMKAGGDLNALRLRLEKYLSWQEDWDWRLDFNGSVNLSELKAWLESLPTEFRKRIVYLEDPACEGDWGQLAVPCAEDRCQRSSGRAAYRVVKPALMDWRDLNPEEKLVFTSNMQHPLGQVLDGLEAAAAVRAGRSVALCGLMTQHLFADPEISALLGEFGPVPGDLSRLVDYLHDLRWEAL